MAIGALGIGCAIVWDIPDREHDPRVSCAGSACACVGGFGDCDGHADNGCETELETDERHCGACGRDCQGGACSSGQCGPVQVVAAQRVTGIAIDHTFVYFTTGADGSLNTQQTTIARAPRAGGAAEAVRTLDKRFGPTSLHVHGGRLFWAESDPLFFEPSAMLTQSISPGSPPDTLVTKDDSIPSLAVDGGHVYFITGANTGWGPQEFALERVALAGGAAEPILIRPAVMSALRIDGDSAYWSELGTVASAPLAGGDVTVVATQTVAMAVDDSNVYWLARATVSGTQRDTLWRRSKLDGTETVLASDQSMTSQIASDGAHIFWTANVHSGGVASLMKVSVTGGQPEELARTNLEGSVNIAVDQTTLFWATPDAIMKLAK
jgi:hypothetical protein